ncbi:beta-ketoacyl synthase chain length factor [Luedemannella helvata]|uniref:beta-ketoacyl synthase chain length factor n=1 Tax=Luedemannella helvata TaxID=349315 RepID=UPI0031D01E26
MAAAHEAGLTVRSAAAWPAGPDDALPSLPGFVDSTFSPLVAAVAARCLSHREPADPTALVLLSPLGDVATAVHLAHAVDHGERVGPLLFFQSVPNAVAGHVAARWGLRGPVVCLSADASGLAAAALLLADGDADAALVIVADQAPPGSAATDRAAAVLVTAVTPVTAVTGGKAS